MLHATTVMLSLLHLMGNQLSVMSERGVGGRVFF